MSVLNRNAFAVASAPVSAVTAICIDYQLVEIRMPDAMFQALAAALPSVVHTRIDIYTAMPTPIPTSPGDTPRTVAWLGSFCDGR